ncbi:MAG: UDP-N-acetylglucosamine--N-acetylmuramyl-(pentapeptide) pyrophosphoryl-undecaprenol [Candidatus Saccharibacteria bacterium]|nr:UDP-N-acetylglucosamine--N-acetylmuramyl-(pentapeptide) pyrophosphoryl-undecaprenol [Candidatus Saccharibacteria bacterium]
MGDIPAKDPNIDKVFTVRAGKFRRYHGQGWRQLLDVKTNLLNLRDGIFVLVGLVQSWRLLRAIRPQVIFVKGGFVGVPVGLAAARLKIPFVTHDSDSIPGLANRIIGRWASVHAVALPKGVYDYPQDKTETVGIPLSSHFEYVTPALKKHYRTLLKVPQAAPMIFVIGGGLGAQRVNHAVAQAIPHLMQEFPNLYVVHGVGRANHAVMEQEYARNLTEAQAPRLEVKDFISDVYRYGGAADIVITRAGATNLAEFAMQGKACVIIPSPYLTSGHQTKNAEFLRDAGAGVVLSESELAEDPNRLAKQLSTLLKDTKLQQSLGEKLHEFAHEDAAHRLAMLLLRQAK